MKIDEDTVRIREYKPSSILPAIVWSCFISSLISFAIAWGIARRLHPGVSLKAVFSGRRHPHVKPAYDSVQAKSSINSKRDDSAPTLRSPVGTDAPKTDVSKPPIPTNEEPLKKKTSNIVKTVKDSSQNNGSSGADSNPTASPPESSTHVPQLKDLSAADARALLAKHGLKLVIDGETNSATVKGHVATQKPLSGTSLNTGSEVHVMVAAGLRKIQIPNVIGLTVKMAKKAIKDAGLRIDEVTYGKTGTPGKVIETDPPVGSLALSSDAVQLMAGPGAVMPRLIGRSKATAQRRLRALGLKITRIRFGQDDDRSLGRILRQSPAAGQPISPDTPITITVNSE